jgi:hypothetical protein
VIQLKLSKFPPESTLVAAVDQLKPEVSYWNPKFSSNYILQHGALPSWRVNMDLNKLKSKEGVLPCLIWHISARSFKLLWICRTLHGPHCPSRFLSSSVEHTWVVIRIRLVRIPW